MHFRIFPVSEVSFVLRRKKVQEEGKQSSEGSKIKKKRIQLYCFNNRVRNAWDKYHTEGSIKQVRSLLLTFMAIPVEVETYVYQKTHTRTFIVALFIIA